MATTERYDDLVLGSGTGGKSLAWTLAKEGRRIAVIERRLIGGSCSNVACLPTKNIVHTAKVVSLFHRHRERAVSRHQNTRDRLHSRTMHS
jgi:pyruvate/2-oxoglutarate dehydrogenase complex dihydrolipoamide dehydrogenase (E3) component